MSLQVIEGIQEQSTNEEIAYAINTTPWGGSPSGPSAVAYDVDSGMDVTATVFPVNAPSVLGDVITLSKLKLLVKGKTYRIEVLFTQGTNILECYLLVKCTM